MVPPPPSATSCHSEKTQGRHCASNCWRCCQLPMMGRFRCLVGCGWSAARSKHSLLVTAAGCSDEGSPVDVQLPEVSVRPGQLSDLDEAFAVWRAASMAWRPGRALSPERDALERKAASLPDAFLLVAEESGTIVGMTLAMHERAQDGAGALIPGHCYISLVEVVPDRWGQGIGRRLVDAVLAEAKERDYIRVRLWTDRANQRAQRLYASCGFYQTGRE